MDIVIIDDESKARSLLVNVLKEGGYSEKTIHTATNLEEGVSIIREMNPQLVFLDIEMPKQQGIEILNYFEKEEITFEIVFTTAYSQYAIQAFEMNAIDYILKPIRPKRVLEVVNKVKLTKNNTEVKQKFDELRKSLKSNTFDKIGLPVSNGILFIPLEEIIHMEADGMYTKFHVLSQGSIIVSKPLKFFEHIINSNPNFYRPHRSHIFNVKFLKQYVNRDGNYVILENDHVIPISKDKKEEFLEIVSTI